MIFSFGAFILLLALYAWLIEPRLFRIRTASFALGGEKHRTLLITDLHFGFARFGHSVLLKKIKKAHARDPYDSILLGGDYIDSNLAYLQQLKEWMAGLAGLGIPMYGVLGDHDNVIVDPKPIVRLLTQLGVTMIDGEATELAGHALIGITELRCDPQYNEMQIRRPFPPEAKVAMRLRVRELKLPKMGPRPAIVLCHNPDIIFSKAIPDGSLVLSGHTHGGQMWPLTWMGESVWRWLPGGSLGCWAGTRTINKKTLFVSRGAGSSWKPFRLGCRPEAVTIELT